MAVLDDITSTLLAAVEDEVRQLAPGRATVRQTADSAGGDPVVSLEDIENRADRAQMRILIPTDASGRHDEYVLVDLGRGISLEIPFDADWGPLGRPLDEEVRALVRAVLSGEIEETVTFRGDRIQRSDAVITIGDKAVTPSHSLGFVGREPKRVETIKYQPYV